RPPLTQANALPLPGYPRRLPLLSDLARPGALPDRSYNGGPAAGRTTLPALQGPRRTPTRSMPAMPPEHCPVRARVSWHQDELPADRIPPPSATTPAAAPLQNPSHLLPSTTDPPCPAADQPDGTNPRTTRTEFAHLRATVRQCSQNAACHHATPAPSRRPANPHLPAADQPHECTAPVPSPAPLLPEPQTPAPTLRPVRTSHSPIASMPPGGETHPNRITEINDRPPAEEQLLESGPNGQSENWPAHIRRLREL